MLDWIRVIWRFIFFIVSTTLHIAWFGMVLPAAKPVPDSGKQLRRKWLRTVPRQLGIRTVVHGRPYIDGACLYVANHISYLDPVIILEIVDANVVAKSEVSRWPLVGIAGRMAGVIFVNRTKKESRYNTARAIRQYLENGLSILVFPEGTTTRGHGTLPFRPRSFEAAQSAGVPVQPVAIRYFHGDVPFVDDQTFLSHFFRLFKQKIIHARLVFGPVIREPDAADLCRHWIDETISAPLMHAV